MQIDYDRQADALYIYLQPNKYVTKSKEVGEGLVLDLDKNGKAIGLEILDVSKKYKKTDISKFSIKDLITSRSLSRV